MRVEEVMCRNVHYCRPEESLAEAAKLMWDHDCGCAPVCTGDGGQRLVGMITDRDITMCALFQGKALGEIKVADAMSRSVSACRPEDASSMLEQLMRDRQIRRVPVIDDHAKLVGIVSLADLAREAAPTEVGLLSSAYITDAEISDTLAAICESPDSRDLAQTAQSGSV